MINMSVMDFICAMPKTLRKSQIVFWCFPAEEVSFDWCHFVHTDNQAMVRFVRFMSYSTRGLLWIYHVLPCFTMFFFLTWFTKHSPSITHSCHIVQHLACHILPCAKACHTACPDGWIAVCPGSSERKKELGGHLGAAQWGGPAQLTSGAPIWAGRIRAGHGRWFKHVQTCSNGFLNLQSKTNQNNVLSLESSNPKNQIWQYDTITWLLCCQFPSAVLFQVAATMKKEGSSKPRIRLSKDAVL